MMADVTACAISSGRCAVVVEESYAGSSSASPPLACVIDKDALSDCNGVVTHNLTHCTKEEGRVARSLLARGEGVHSTLVSRGWGVVPCSVTRGDAKITKAGLRIAAPPKRDADQT